MLPTHCPSCNNQLKVKCLKCDECNTEVNGSYELPIYLLLTQKDQEFILKFVKYSGSLKEMANELKLSYPTVRNMLNDIIDRINSLEEIQSTITK
ncbi:MAG: DUF2089 domain-containing protein [Bacteroidales bacterium]|jgi:hypothetical protein|nr:DUF2089 domain-containing protein [Bacteroidales bacterium]